LLRNVLASPEQASPWQVRSPLLSYRPDTFDAVAASTIANTASAAAAVIALAGAAVYTLMLSDDAVLKRPVAAEELAR